MASTESDTGATELERRLLGEIPHLRRLLGRLVHRAEEAEDLLQDVLERALRYRGSFDPAGSLRGWLTRTAVRVSLDHRERRARTPEALGDQAAEIVDARPAWTETEVEDGEEVERALRKLSQIEREVLLRFHREEHGVAEIAADLGLPVGTVKSHLHRARRRLAGGDGA